MRVQLYLGARSGAAPDARDIFWARLTTGLAHSGAGASAPTIRIAAMGAAKKDNMSILQIC